MNNLIPGILLFLLPSVLMPIAPRHIRQPYVTRSITTDVPVPCEGTYHIEAEYRVKVLIQKQDNDIPAAPTMLRIRPAYCLHWCTTNGNNVTYVVRGSRDLVHWEMVASLNWNAREFNLEPFTTNYCFFVVSARELAGTNEVMASNVKCGGQQ